jgi:predicted RNase H-like nuclease (RuvC/YqgF family)
MLAARLLMPKLQLQAQACQQTAFPVYRPTGAASQHLPAASAPVDDATSAQQEFSMVLTQQQGDRDQNTCDSALAGTPVQDVLVLHVPGAAGQLERGISGTAAATALHSSNSSSSDMAAMFGRLGEEVQQVFDRCLDKSALVGKLAHEVEQLTRYNMQQGVEAGELRSSLEANAQQVQQLTSDAAQLKAENQRLTEQVQQLRSDAQLKLAQIQLVLGGKSASAAHVRS